MSDKTLTSLSSALIERFAAGHPQQAARALEAVNLESAGSLMVLLPTSAQAEILRFLHPQFFADMLTTLPVLDGATLVRAARKDIAALALRRLDRDRRKDVLATLEDDISSQLNRLLAYPQESAGMLMDPHVFSVPSELTVEQVLVQVRDRAEHALYYVYITGPEQRLDGVVNLREMLCAKPTDRIIDIANKEIEVIHAAAPLDRLLAHPGWARVHALPVGIDGQLVGVIRYSNLRTLERRARGSSNVDRMPKTGAALAELYGIGLRGLVSGGVSMWSSDEEVGQ